jgi:tRNA 2-thiouridine synthesizing protein D
MSSFTIIITESPYSNSRAYTGLRFALTAVLEGHKVNLFLIENGVYVAKAGQKTPNPQANISKYLEDAIKENIEVKICTPCAEARGLTQSDMVPGPKFATMYELVEWSANTDKTLVF